MKMHPRVPIETWRALDGLGFAVVMQAAADCGVRGDVASLCELLRMAQNDGCEPVTGFLGTTVTFDDGNQARRKRNDEFGVKSSHFTVQRAVALALGRPHGEPGAAASNDVLDTDNVPSALYAGTRSKRGFDAQERELLSLAMDVWDPAKVPNRRIVPMQRFVFECCAWVNCAELPHAMGLDAVLWRTVIARCEFNRPRRFVTEEDKFLAPASPLELAVQRGNVHTALALTNVLGATQDEIFVPEMARGRDAVSHKDSRGGLQALTRLLPTQSMTSLFTMGEDAMACLQLLDAWDRYLPGLESSQVRLRVLHTYLDYCQTDFRARWHEDVVAALMHGAQPLGQASVPEVLRRVLCLRQQGAKWLPDKPDVLLEDSALIEKALQTQCDPVLACMPQLLAWHAGAEDARSRSRLLFQLSKADQRLPVDLDAFSRCMALLDAAGCPVTGVILGRSGRSSGEKTIESNLLYELARHRHPQVIPIMLKAMEYGCDPDARTSHGRSVAAALSNELRGAWVHALASLRARKAALRAMEGECVP